MNYTEDKNLITLEGEYEADVLPEKHLDLHKDILIKNNSRLKGRIYGKKIHIEDGAKIWGEIFAKEKIIIDIGKKVIILSPIASKGFIISQNASRTFQESDLNILIYGDIISKIINLQNAMIVGSLYADEVVLSNSIIFGIVNASQSINIENVVSFSFYAKEVKKAEYITSIFPHSIIGDSENPVKNIRWLPFCLASTYKECPTERIMCERYLKGECSDYVKLESVDKLIFENATIFTLAKRIVDITKLKNIFKEIYDEYKLIFNSSKIKDGDYENLIPLFSKNEKFRKSFNELRKEFELKVKFIR